MVYYAYMFRNLECVHQLIPWFGCYSTRTTSHMLQRLQTDTDSLTKGPYKNRRCFMMVP